GKTAEKALRFYEQDLGYRYDVLGLMEDFPERSTVAEKYPVLGGMWDAGRIVQETGVKTVVITAPGLAKEQLQKLISQVQLHVRNISFVPDLLGTQVMGVEANVFFTEEMLVLKLRNNLARRKNIFVKRVFDLLLSAVILLPVLAVMLCVAIAIKCESKGPVFFNAGRIGKHGREFLCYKFRSMYMNADEILERYLTENAEARAEWNEFQKLKGYDPRVTRVGRIIRRTSLDELPQILNVLLGNMSLVGPRPYLPREKEKMGSHFDTICMTTPGITGFWQVSGRSDVSFAGRLHLDEWYVHNWSVWVDVMCLFKTVKIVVFGKGAY
ncbi:MAG: exopolysaccharide biosynthesis polyprenyl glycosylphosphotransferase, partial [Selenomonadaceae bacterium]|nr:exopolysaccharide biosynthesis polyprenyl glycosylphosphotransferase [Selenomonadaceae bacterium]